jgi:hypothetical protein
MGQVLPLSWVVVRASYPLGALKRMAISDCLDGNKDIQPSSLVNSFQAASTPGDGLPRYTEGRSQLPLNLTMPLDSIASFAGAVMGQEGISVVPSVHLQYRCTSSFEGARAHSVKKSKVTDISTPCISHNHTRRKRDFERGLVTVSLWESFSSS